jgi:hypothetical protein
LRHLFVEQFNLRNNSKKFPTLLDLISYCRNAELQQESLCLSRGTGSQHALGPASATTFASASKRCRSLSSL